MNFTELFAQGQEYLDNENYEKAFECFSKITEPFDKYGKAMYFAASSSNTLGRYEEATEYWMRVPETDEYYHDAMLYLDVLKSTPAQRFERGKELYDKQTIQDMEDALSYFYEIDEEDKEYGEATFLAGLALYSLDDSDEAINCLKRIPKGDKKYDDAIFYIGMIYKDVRYYKHALEYLEQIPNTSVIHHDSLFQQGVVNHLDGNFDKALEFYAMIPSSSPLYNDAIQSIAMISEAKKNKQ